MSIILGIAGLFCYPSLTWANRHSVRHIKHHSNHASKKTVKTKSGHRTLKSPKTTNTQNKTSNDRADLLRAQQRKQQLLEKSETEKKLAQEAQKNRLEAQQKAQQDAYKARQIITNMVAATTELQDTEKQAADLSDRIQELKVQEKNLDMQLREESQNLARFLPLIERLSLYPADTLLAAPMNSSKSIIGLSIIQSLSSRLEIQAQQIRQHQTELQQLRKDLLSKNKTLETVIKKQSIQRNQLVIAAKIAKENQKKSSAAASKAAIAAAKAAQNARNINDAIQRIEAERQAAEKRLAAEIAAAKRANNLAKAEAAQKQASALNANNSGPGLIAQSNSRNAPVVGPIISRWGTRTDSGPAQGITYAPPSSATVRAPCRGQVEFSGPFRAYGKMIILNCGKQYRFVLAGMAQLEVAIGQNINKGVIVGQMPSWNGSNVGKPTLYVQLRLGTRAINPAPFL
ncbi:MAG: peptidoglycan DD-metalloendopeptidase family protein [Commensalibacter sp.]|nr:peptidoglycan DD-metalloendopeptidase family protein [Commensalibacter sp.]